MHMHVLSMRCRSQALAPLRHRSDRSSRQLLVHPHKIFCCVLVNIKRVLIRKDGKGHGMTI